jgi:hypothetical protein
MELTIEKEKLKKLVSSFYEVCSLCDECDIYEHEELDDSMQKMKEWVNENFGRNLSKLKN